MMLATDASHGSGAATGVPAKSLLGNRFVGRHPSASIAASRRRGAFRATDIDGSGTDGGVPANKAIPEERLGRHPGGRAAA